ncbi:MAG: dihydrofolate reductase [Flavobacteriaceae bacterium]|jgi:dihydrofolate reductase|nr:dihydrofolate reductase [Flavobacteriaceae bacterium]MDG1064173.1 dihydrofolate reductase [Flavobacteriaceae bacterium]
MITLIAAAGTRNELGRNNDLVWHLPDDFKRFKTLTSGHHIIMGRKTFDSFPKLLPHRTHIVITRNQDFKAEGVICVSNLEQALAMASEDPDPYVIGGGEIYALALPIADAIELTRVHGEFESDTFFPELDPEQWDLVNEHFHDKDERHDFSFTYLTYHRRK